MKRASRSFTDYMWVILMYSQVQRNAFVNGRGDSVSEATIRQHYHTRLMDKPVNIDSSALVSIAHELADASAGTIDRYFRAGVSIDNKSADGGFDPVTEADRAAEQTIRAILAERHPDHGILGEEFEAKPATGEDVGFQWVLDPIDGTRAFILGLPTWGTLIGLNYDGSPLIGVMNQPFTRERFWSDGTASYFRGPDGATTRITTRTAQLASAQLSTTTPDMFKEGDEAHTFDAVRARVRACRYGGDCYAYCLLAMGLIDVVMEAGLKPYDIVALIPIIENAGGVVTDWYGGPAAHGGRILACGDPALHDQILEIIRTASS
jgi:histidinol-phosphatase